MSVIHFKNWYYNYRLMCIDRDRCVAGTVVGQPHDATDGDRKLDLLLAPFNVPETEQLLIELLDERRGVLPNVPDVIDLQNRQILLGYVRGLSDNEQRELYIRLCDEKLFSQASREFQRHYHRRDAAAMGAAAFSASPDDTLAASPPNPMFRYSAAEGGDPEERVLVPWLHCEIEGNRLARRLDNVLVGLGTGLAAAIAICVLCEVVTLGALDFLCGWIGAGAVALLAFLAWLISRQVNDPDEGVAGEIDVDVQDPDFDTPASEARAGDVVLAYGDWIMDMEHDNYFEIHPVKAYYLLCRSEADPDDWKLTEEVPASECDFDVRVTTSEMMDRMCRIVRAVENTDPDEGFTTGIAAGLAMVPPGAAHAN